jgi:hypothetical protein
MLQLLYFSDFCIFEALIRKGLVSGQVEIADHQIKRILYPVMNNKNKSLLHHFCENNNLISIQKVFLNIEKHHRKQNNIAPFFIDFEKGRSAIDIALDNMNYPIF